MKTHGLILELTYRALQGEKAVIVEAGTAVKGLHF